MLHLGSYDENTQVNLSASVNSVYDFVKRMKEGVEVTQNAAYSLNATEDASLIVHFIARSTDVEFAPIRE